MPAPPATCKAPLVGEFDLVVLAIIRPTPSLKRPCSLAKSAPLVENIISIELYVLITRLPFVLAALPIAYR